jgi:hypothetical protein
VICGESIDHACLLTGGRTRFPGQAFDRPAEDFELGLTRPVAVADRAQTKSEEIARPDLGALPPLVLRCSSGLSGLGPGITGGTLDSDKGQPGPFYIQGDHTGGMKYRNITISLPK